MFKTFYDTKILNEVTRVLEFYEKLGLLPMFENGAILSTNQIYMNPEAQALLLDGLIQNMNKNECYQNLDYEEAYSMVTYDFANFAPQTNPELAFDAIMILPLEDAEFKSATPVEKII